MNLKLAQSNAQTSGAVTGSYSSLRSLGSCYTHLQPRIDIDFRFESGRLFGTENYSVYEESMRSLCPSPGPKVTNATDGTL